MFRKKCEHKAEICLDIIVGFIYPGLKGKLNDDIKKAVMQELLMQFRIQELSFEMYLSSQFRFLETSVPISP